MENKIKIYLVILVSLFSFTSICIADDLFVSRAPIVFKPYQRLEPQQTVGGYPILNFTDNLWLVNLKTHHVSGAVVDVPMGFAVMVSSKDNEFLASLQVYANLEPSSYAADWTGEPCKNDSFLWKRSIGGKFSNINCVTISYVTKFSPDIPTVVNVVFTRYSSSAKMLSYSININPEVFGVERDAEPVWENNSWNKNRVQDDPKKVGFLVHLEKWAEDVQNKMDDAFSKKPDAFSSIPLLVSYF